MDNSPQKTKEYYKGLLEALVFLSAEPIKLSSIATSAGIDKSLAREILDEIVLEFEERNGGFILKEIAGAYQFFTNDAYFQILGTIFKEKRRETLSKSTLDTLAIIAYKQPITLPEIEEIRGVSSRAMITTLTAKKLIKPIGQKEVPGRPTLYGTTSEFLVHFGLNKLSDLPPPHEVKELRFEDLEDLKSRKTSEEEISSLIEEESSNLKEESDLETQEFEESSLSRQTEAAPLEVPTIPHSLEKEL